MTENSGDKRSTIGVGEACAKVERLYNTGTNCDKAVLLVLFEMWNLPAEEWGLDDFYSDKPDNAERFLCKVAAAGAVAIYLDVLHKNGLPVTPPPSVDRIITLVNRFLFETTGDGAVPPAAFNPFDGETESGADTPGNSVLQEYRDRAGAFFKAFEEEFKNYNCQDILGFDPFRYGEYDDQMQEYIEEGEWMQKCVQCMKFIIRSHTN